MEAFSAPKESETSIVKTKLNENRNIEFELSLYTVMDT